LPLWRAQPRIIPWWGIKYKIKIMKNSDFLNNLQKYFRETPKEEVIRQWEETAKEWDGVGITVEEFFEKYNNDNHVDDER
jgi:hypothetical protein